MGLAQSTRPKSVRGKYRQISHSKVVLNVPGAYMWLTFQISCGGALYQGYCCGDVDRLILHQMDLVGSGKINNLVVLPNLPVCVGMRESGAGSTKTLQWY
jgi:hypothetical protein